MPEDDEKRFLVMVIKDLLQLCEAKHGKYNKAVVASCIMYVTSQYPRFLKAHWKFLKTVVNKLFEFMHELHPGVQDMACDTFIKIAKKCKSKFLHLQDLEDMPFVDRLLIDLPSTIHDLKAHQVQTFYEAVGHMISAEKSNPARRNELLLRLMHLPHTEWERAMANAGQSLMSLCEPATVNTITRTVRTMVQVCKAVGHPFIDYLQRVYGNMMQVYKVYSEVRRVVVSTVLFLSSNCARAQPSALFRSRPALPHRAPAPRSRTALPLFARCLLTNSSPIARPLVLHPLRHIVCVDALRGNGRRRSTGRSASSSYPTGEERVPAFDRGLH